MEIKQISENKKQYLPLLLLGDEQEDMIDRYLPRGVMYALCDGNVKAVCVVTDEGGGVLLRDMVYLRRPLGKGEA